MNSILDKPAYLGKEVQKGRAGKAEAFDNLMISHYLTLI